MSGWSDEDKAKLKKLWTTKMSATDIGQTQLSIQRTKNAVLGQAKRMGLGEKPDRAPSAARNPKRGRKVEPVTRKAKTPPPKVTAPKPKRAPPVMINAPEKIKADPFSLCSRPPQGTGCKWPIGDPRTEDFHFCGRKPEIGAYCLEHAAKAYEPASTKRATTPARVYTRTRT